MNAFNQTEIEKRPKRGKYVVLGGIQGTGKSTTLRNAWPEIQKTLGESNVSVVREPGGTELAEEIRDILINVNRKYFIDSMAEAGLFAVIRGDLRRRVIIPKLKEGKHVFSDRGQETSEIIQGEVRGLGRDYVQRVNNLLAGELTPDLEIIFDLHPNVARKRIEMAHANDMHKFRMLPKEEFEQIWEAYRNRAKRLPYAVLLDASQSKEKVVKDFLQILRDRKILPLDT